jgi:hypothetical protein
MIDNLRLTESGNLKKGNATYVEIEACGHCGDPYLTVRDRPSNYCSHSCSLLGGRHPLYGKHPSTDWRQKMSESAKKRGFDWNPNYKGGVEKRGIPLFDTFSHQINFADETRMSVLDDLKVLEVKCTYCGKWFMPSIISVRSRIAALNRVDGQRSCGEGRFYCSDSCRNSCSIFQRRKYPKGFKPATSREVQPELRQLVFERDDYTCQKCGKFDTEIHCHHIDPVSQNPIESADIDNCITLCKGCHKEVHKQEGCGYNELKCEEVF